MGDFNLIFMGTPDFAIPSLQALVYNGYRVSAVVTRPDRPRGRGKKPAFTPVKEFSQREGLQCLEPAMPKDPGFLAQIRQLAPSLIVTAAYGKILPAELLAIPTLGCINLHPSLLPLYRGAAPVQRAIMDGASETGVTVYFMDQGMDTGDVVLRESVPIGRGETAGELLARLSKSGAGALVKAVSLIEGGKAPRIPQEHGRATYAPPIQREEERIDWSVPAGTAAGRINGLSPSPGGHTRFRGRRLKLLRALPALGSGWPGTVLEANREGIVVACGRDAVLVPEVQPEGKKTMPAPDFSHGYRVVPGVVFDGS